MDPIALIDVARVHSGDEHAWARSLFPELRRAVDGRWRGAACLASCGTVVTSAAARRQDAPAERWLLEWSMQLHAAAPACGLASLSGAKVWRGRFANVLKDVVLLSVPRPAEAPIVFVVAVPHVVCIDLSRRHYWHRLAVHLAGTLLVHRETGQLAAKVDAGAAGLREAVCRVDRHHGMASRATDALGLFYGLLAGRWRLVDRFDAGGRRYLVAQRGAPDARLTRRQRQVVFHAALGSANGEIAHALGLAHNTVSAHLHRALDKLGLGSRSDLVRLSTRVTSAVAEETRRCA